jgi:CheY-like chemotaxis protein
MRWLLHGSLAHAIAEALKRHGHQVTTLQDAKIESEDLTELLQQAHKQQLDVITADAQVPDIVFQQKIPFGRSIVFLQLAGGDVEQDDAIDRLFERYKRLSPGRLYTVTATRVKIRQLPSA